MAVKVLDHGYVSLRNLSGPVRRRECIFDADDVDPAQTARMSFAQVDVERPREADLALAEYLMKNDHTTPIEMIETWWEMKMPIFVARQFMRHRTVSINEISGRYVKLPKEFYVPDADIIGVQAKSQKQGRTIDSTKTPNEVAIEFTIDLHNHCLLAYEMYENYLAHGIPHEIARSALPLNIYTRWIWKQDLHNLMHFLSLRSHSHAQFEARQYANAIIRVLRDYLPHSMELFDKYRRKN